MRYTTYTVQSYEVEGKQYFSHALVMKLTEIRHGETFSNYLGTLGLSEKYLGWSEIRAILNLKHFLRKNPGYHSHAMYQFLMLKRENVLAKLLRQLGIDEEVEREFQKIKHYYTSTPSGNSKFNRAKFKIIKPYG